MNRTAILRERRSVSIAEAALRDPSTAEILRDTGFAQAVHDLPERPSVSGKHTPTFAEDPVGSEDSYGDLPQLSFGGLLWEDCWYGAPSAETSSGD